MRIRSAKKIVRRHWHYRRAIVSRAMARLMSAGTRRLGAKLGFDAMLREIGTER